MRQEENTHVSQSGSCGKPLPSLAKVGARVMRLKFLKGRNSEKGPVEVQLMWLEGGCSAVGVGVPQKTVIGPASVRKTANLIRLLVQHWKEVPGQVKNVAGVYWNCKCTKAVRIRKAQVLTSFSSLACAI